MTRRKQDCPKRMKWEGGEEGSPEEADKLDGDDELESMSPSSAISHGRHDDDDDDVCSPPPPELLTPTSPRSFHGADHDLQRQHHLRSRCDSRDSADSPPLRSPSGESMISERAALLRGLPLGTSLSPVGVALPPSLPAAAFLPPQSAAITAYLNAAAAAAQQSHRLMMTSPLPPPFMLPPPSPTGGGYGRLSPAREQTPAGEGILDFSKRKSDDSDGDYGKAQTPPPPPPREGASGSCPLDLSVGSRKRCSEEPLSYAQQRKPRPADLKPQWPSHLPYFAAGLAASPKPNSGAELWNGKPKPPATNDATKALEKMSELSKLGGEELFRVGNSAANRHSAWQSHWLNKGAEQAKDVLKCVWCKQSFPSLAAMTTHMKEAKHCGVNVPMPPMQTHQPQPPISSPSNSSSSSNKPGGNDINMLIKETMPLPRKLVRGQDVWLGKGAEQTRQILKCMWCGQSFRSLAEMTSHMQQTQHYTNIISQEQIISWRSTDDPKGGGGGGGGGGGHSGPPPGGASSHVSAVLTCKVCDQAFSSLKELSNHMVKNSHYKEHIMRSITESGGRRRQTREKRKKSLPVRKLLELERAQHDFKNGDGGGILEKMRDAAGAGRITCEKCGNKIETAQFVDHIRQCVGGMTSHQRNFLKSALMSTSGGSGNVVPAESPDREKLKTPTPSPSPHQSPNAKDGQAPAANNGSSPSVLNAIEKLIEKSFDSRSRQSATFPAQTPMGSSILKRLGIDESVDYTKPLVDAQTMNLLRSYHHQQQQQQQHYARRERSGSESSSMSERGSSRVDAMTPERKMEPPSGPRSTPEVKREKSPPTSAEKHDTVVERQQVSVKKEVEEEERAEVKMEREEEEERRSFHSDGDVASKEDDDDVKAPAAAASPASSERSGTPRSANGDKKPSAGGGGGSLGALSSMFDSLSGASEPAPATGGKRGSSHPLAALQKLCDKTETNPSGRSAPSTAASPSSSVAASTSSGGTTPGAILAFSWACNDAVVTSDSVMKCAFCDTPFISKGAYRHHLSKMHFVKDGVMPDPVALKSPPLAAPGGVPLKSTAPAPAMSMPGAGKSPPAGGSGFEESPHSKFLKYTELAKQLSSKYV